MTVRPITMIGHKALHQRTKKIREITPELRTLVEDMIETNAAAQGAGLAATQVGSRWRLFVYACTDGNGVLQEGYVLNPVLEKGPTVPLEEDMWEGCLSVPGEGFPTARSEWARVTGIDLEGQPVTVEDTGGVLARCLQHEVDHLDGKLYLDRLTSDYRRQAHDAIRHRGWRERGILSWDPTATDAEKV
ncbi:peptide deformylase [Devriesea agamarum]|uniref:peptide deformylase n=1 Tax=Devriesea agamarum TaxID=472569 RepID=UPI00071D629F|nr:peptide deformylase [Devriesea agamarum]